MSIEETIKGLEEFVRDFKPFCGNQTDWKKVYDAIALLKECEQRRRLEVHNIGNVDIPDGVTWEKFQTVMNNVVDALEHTDRGESWPYEDTKRKVCEVG